MLVFTEHNYPRAADDPRRYYIVAGAGLRRSRTRPDHVQVAADAEMALVAAMDEAALVAAVTELALHG